MFKPDLKKYIRFALFIFIVVVIIVRLVHYIQVVLFTYPLEYRDIATLDATSMFAGGKNVWSLQYVPAHMYVYGFIFPAIAAIGKIIFSGVSSIILLKALSLFFIFAYTFITGRELFIRTHNRLLTVAGSAVIFQSVIINPRPDTLGLFCFTACLVLAQRTNNNIRRLFLLAVLSAACFYIKQYFVLCVPIIMFYYYTVSRKILIFYTAMVLFVVIAAGTVINAVFPLYFPMTFIHHINYATINIPHMIIQSIEFGSIYYVFLTVLGIYIAGHLFKKIRPIGEPHHVDIFFIAFVAALIALTFSLGLHIGDYMMYYYQLLTIPLVISVFTIAYNGIKWNTIKIPQLTKVIMLGACTVLLNTKTSQGTDVRKQVIAPDRWEKTLNMIAQHNPQHGYFSPPIAAVGIDRGWPIYDNGQTEFFETAYTSNSALRTLFPESIRIPGRSTQWQQEIDRKMRRREFSIIAVTQGYHPYVGDTLLSENYRLAETADFYIGLDFTRKTELWLPRESVYISH